MDKNTMDFELSSEEQLIRIYECTQLRRFFAPPTIGYLTVTNKRLIYHSHSKGLDGSSSKILAEMSLEEISGISASVNISINWINYVLGGIALFIVTRILIGLLPEFATGWVISILLLIPYFILWLFEKEILSKKVGESILTQLDTISTGKYLKNKGKRFYDILFFVLWFIGLVLIAWNLVNIDLLSGYPWIRYMILGGVYIYLGTLIFGRRRSFSLRVASKGRGNGIYIPGNAYNLFLSGDMTAVQTLTAGPAKDAERVVSELGALLTDIRLLGDLGISKWTEQV